MPRRVLCCSGIAGPAMGCGSRGAAACGGTGPAPSALPKTTLSACTVDGLLAECGNVWVPQDWAHPDGPVMPLQVVVLPAATTRHPAAPLFYLTGLGAQAAGDGDSVLNGMSWAAQAFQQLNQTIAVGHILTVRDHPDQPRLDPAPGPVVPPGDLRQVSPRADLNDQLFLLLPCPLLLSCPLGARPGDALAFDRRRLARGIGSHRAYPGHR